MGHNTSLRTIALVLGLVISLTQMAAPALGSRLGFLTLNPATYTSPSGQYRLEANPSTLYGQGEGTCRVTRDGAEVWSKTLPVTLWQAAIADDGTVAGYGYSHGAEGFVKEGQNRDEGPGTFHVVILDPQGRFRLNQVTPREGSRFEDGMPDPKAEGMWIDPTTDRVIVRVADADVNRQSESWWCYRLSTGEALKRLEPRRALADTPERLFVCGSRPVRGAPLVLVHWYRYQNSQMGAIFALLDPEGSAVWRLDLPEDYVVRNDDGAKYRLLGELQRPGMILKSNDPGCFEVRFVAEGKRVTFAVERAPNEARDKWLVREVGRAAYVPASQPAAVLPVVELRHVGAIALMDGREKPRPVQLGAVRTFTVDHAGRFYAVEERTSTVLVFERDGTLLRRCEPQRKDFESNMSADEITVRGDGSVFIAQGLSISGKHRYLRFDPNGRRGGFEELGIDPINEQWQFVPGGSSRWVAGYERVYRVDDAGKVVETIGRRSDGTWLEHVGELAVAADGSMAVACDRGGLRQSDVAVCIYAADGRPVRTIALPGDPQVLDVQYKGGYILAWVGEKVLLISADGRFVGQVRIDLRQRSQHSDRPLLSPDGKELWRLSEDQRQIERFALPDKE